MAVMGYPHRLPQLRNFQASVRGVSATVIEKVADIVRSEYLDQALVFNAAFGETFEFMAAGAESA